MAEFRDKALEKEFYNAEIAKNLNYIKFTILIAGLVYFLFIIPEYFLIKDATLFISIFINRCIIFVLLMFLYIKVSRDKTYFSLIYWFTAYEIIISLSFIYVSNQFPSPDLLIQSFGVMLMVLTIFLINNRWLYSVFTSLFVSTGYFIFSTICFNDVPFAKFSAAIVYILIVIVLSSISSYSINYYKRIQYQNTIELLKMVENDALTGIYNKAKFNQEYARLAEWAEQQNTCLAVVMFDIDDFKEVNDHYGHLAGDMVLTELTKIICKNIFQSDLFARWGGEEFVLIFPDVRLKQAIERVERLRNLIAEYTFGEIGKVTCSFGVAVFEKGDDLEKVLQRSDERLYLAKNSGKNIVK
ncbi:diguanylate cyclase Dgc2 [Acetobacterium woodii DSM 1030]|uniref:Diguanylate cyclase Dgc2 n=1 Tax=Acetobacterium woodii (strain ATCC 29683 / DSM 1030 / JCM 2381 / KCTC 1655 / WB1) TaxID=931626 RepID=H6LJG5_ACEWD|nr:diguanylate cyclase Dgc2 [Acetobacterium woodii DSM 1030]